MDIHAHTLSIQVCVIRPGARTRHGSGGPGLVAPPLVRSLDADHGQGGSGLRARLGRATVPQGGGRVRACCSRGVPRLRDRVGALQRPGGSSMRSKEPIDWSAVVTALAVLGIMAFLFLH